MGLAVTGGSGWKRRNVHTVRRQRGRDGGLGSRGDGGGGRRGGRGGGGEGGVIRVRSYPPAGVLSAFDAVDEL